MKIVYIGASEGFVAARAEVGAAARVDHVEASRAALAAALTDADGLLDASMKVPLDDAMVGAAPRLRIVSCATTGSDHIARKALDERGIPVRTLREDPELLRALTPAAELTWALLMALARRLVPAVAHTRAGLWVREEFPGLMLNGRTLGVIGCGRIGQWMGRYGRAFGMEVIGHDPFVSPWPDGIRRVELECLVENADVVTVHVHLSDATRGLVSRDLFQRMKPGALFLNTSRGAVADEAALLEALESGRVAGAGLDVLEGEPDIDDHPLVRHARKYDTVLITPHCGGFSPDAVRRVCARAARKIVDHLERPTP